jgi:hypothetical protein
MANNFTNDSHCVSLWKFEAADPYADSKGTNAWASGTNVLLDSDAREGSRSISFDVGSGNAYLEIPDANLSSNYPFKYGGTEKAITVAMWVKLSGSPSGSGEYFTLYGKGAYSYADGMNTGFALRAFRYDIHTYWWLHLPWVGDGGNYDPNITNWIPVVVDRWYHIAATYDDSTKAYRLRVYDSVEDICYTDSSGNSSHNINIPNRPLRLGIDSLNAHNFNGKIDEVVVFDKALTPSEIDSIRVGVYPNGIPPERANNPDPISESASQDIEGITLAWDDGGGATSYNVYLGDHTPLTSGNFKGNQNTTSYNTGALESGTQYYWRIDSVNSNGTKTGTTWYFVTGWPAGPGTFYVDFANGSDTNQGRPESIPWKSLEHAFANTSAGDTILVREGVHFGCTVLSTSGTAEAPKTLKAYPGETVVLDRSVALTGFVQCTADDPNLTHGGVLHPHPTNLYKTVVTSIPSAVIEYSSTTTGTMLIQSRNPHTDVAYSTWLGKDSDCWNIPNEGGNLNQNAYIYDSTNLTEPDGYWDGADVLYRSTAAAGGSNWFYTAHVASYSNHKLTFSAPLTTHVPNGWKSGCQYALYNSPMTTTLLGEWCYVDSGGGNYTIYVYPIDAANINNMRQLRPNPAEEGAGNTNFCLGSTNKDYGGEYWTIDGISFQNAFTCFKTILWNGTGPWKGIIVKNCNFINCLGMAAYVYNTDGFIMDNCTMDNCGGSPGSGVQLGLSSNARIMNTSIEKSFASAIYIPGSSNTGVYGCFIGETSIHGNGITYYQGCNTGLIAGNVITTPMVSITIQDSSNMTVWGNLMTKSSGGAGIAIWNSGSSGGTNGYVLMAHNTMINCGWYLEYPYGSASLTFYDNILSGTNFPGETHDYNVFTSELTYPSDINSLAAHEVYEPNTSVVFLRPDLEDYHLKRSSPAIGGAVDLTSSLPTSTFTDYDFTKDMDGKSWSGTDIGCYKFTEYRTKRPVIVVCS